MRTYSIKELERFTGIKAHTIRIWEQRYTDLFLPDRTSSGIRIYNDEDLKKILGISILIKAGIKISKISRLSKKELHAQLDLLKNENNNGENKFEYYISSLLSAGLLFNEDKFVKGFEELQESFSMKEIFLNIIYPLLDRIGLMWNKDILSPVQEHFISNLIRQKLFVAIDSLDQPDENEEIILFLPENESHEIGLLLANFLLKEANIKTIYLGQLVPTSSLIELINQKKCKRTFGFIFISQGIENLHEIINNFTNKCKDTNFYWAGSEDLFKQITLPKRNHFLSNMNEFQDKLIKVI